MSLKMPVPMGIGTPIMMHSDTPTMESSLLLNVGQVREGKRWRG